MICHSKQSDDFSQYLLSRENREKEKGKTKKLEFKSPIMTSLACIDLFFSYCKKI